MKNTKIVIKNLTANKNQDNKENNESSSSNNKDEKTIEKLEDREIIKQVTIITNQDGTQTKKTDITTKFNSGNVTKETLFEDLDNSKTDNDDTKSNESKQDTLKTNKNSSSEEVKTEVIDDKEIQTSIAKTKNPDGSITTKTIKTIKSSDGNIKKITSIEKADNFKTVNIEEIIEKEGDKDLKTIVTTTTNSDGSGTRKTSLITTYPNGTSKIETKEENFNSASPQNATDQSVDSNENNNKELDFEKENIQLSKTSPVTGISKVIINNTDNQENQLDNKAVSQDENNDAYIPSSFIKALNEYIINDPSIDSEYAIDRSKNNEPKLEADSKSDINNKYDKNEPIKKYENTEMWLQKLPDKEIKTEITTLINPDGSITKKTSITTKYNDGSVKRENKIEKVDPDSELSKVDNQQEIEKVSEQTLDSIKRNDKSNNEKILNSDESVQKLDDRVIKTTVFLCEDADGNIMKKSTITTTYNDGSIKTENKIESLKNDNEFNKNSNDNNISKVSTKNNENEKDPNDPKNKNSLISSVVINTNTINVSEKAPDFDKKNKLENENLQPLTSKMSLNDSRLDNAKEDSNKSSLKDKIQNKPTSNSEFGTNILKNEQIENIFKPISLSYSNSNKNKSYLPHVKQEESNIYNLTTKNQNPVLINILRDSEAYSKIKNLDESNIIKVTASNKKLDGNVINYLSTENKYPTNSKSPLNSNYNSSYFYNIASQLPDIGSKNPYFSGSSHQQISKPLTSNSNKSDLYSTGSFDFYMNNYNNYSNNYSSSSLPSSSPIVKPDPKNSDSISTLKYSDNSNKNQKLNKTLINQDDHTNTNNKVNSGEIFNGSYLINLIRDFGSDLMSKHVHLLNYDGQVKLKDIKKSLTLFFSKNKNIIKADEDQLNRALNAIDYNCDGILNYGEFVDFFCLFFSNRNNIKKNLLSVLNEHNVGHVESGFLLKHEAKSFYDFLRNFYGTKEEIDFEQKISYEDFVLKVLPYIERNVFVQ